MKYKNLHKWNLTAGEAVKLQRRLREKIVIRKIDMKKARYVAGVDVSVKETFAKAAVCVFSYPELEAVETKTFSCKTGFPYIPGLLSFREGPVILKCISKIKIEPDVFIFDGQGLAHPRRLGIASHIGVILNKPTIGSAKSHLFGSFFPPEKKKGAYSRIKDPHGCAIGAVLTTRENTKPVFVSPGHLADIPSSIKIILKCSPKYRIPEPVRAAHHAAAL